MSSNKTADRLRTACAKALQLEIDIDELKEQLAAKERMYSILTDETLPGIMDELDVTELSVTSGLTIKCTDVLVGGLPKDDVRRRKALGFIKKSGNEALIKTNFTVAFPKGSSAEASQFRRMLAQVRGAEMSESTTVNHQSYLKVLRDLHADGVHLPLEDLGVTVHRRAKIRTKRA